MRSISLCDDACSRDISGGYSDGVPPLPIPNREVKPNRADGTAFCGRVGSRHFKESGCDYASDHTHFVLYKVMMMQ